MNGTCPASTSADRTAAWLFQPGLGVSEASQIEAIHYEPYQLDHPNLAGCGLNRLYELNELMARAA